MQTDTVPWAALMTMVVVLLAAQFLIPNVAMKVVIAAILVACAVFAVVKVKRERGDS